MNKHIDAYVDGSYRDDTKQYGYGVYLVDGKQEVELYDCGCDADMASIRNVAGEIEAAIVAVNYAIKHKYESITLNYDYMGIERWATGAWRRNNYWTIAYHEFMNKAMMTINVTFNKIKSHSNNIGNDRADALARKAIGV